MDERIRLTARSKSKTDPDEWLILREVGKGIFSLERTDGNQLKE